MVGLADDGSMDDGYVSPEFDLPSESESESVGQPIRSKKLRRSHHLHKQSEVDPEEDLEALALQALQSRNR